MGPSAVFHPKQTKELPEAMTVEQIHAVARAFGDAARRAREAGFDGVEIHSAHGYLLNQFYSPLVNRRKDEYGPQSVENRTRFHREVLQAVRREVGEEYPVAVRLGDVTIRKAAARWKTAWKPAGFWKKAAPICCT